MKRLLWAVPIAALLAGCSKSAPPPGANPGPGSPTANSSTVNASDGDDGLTYNLQPGQVLAVSLSGTTWRFPAASNPSVLSVGAPVVVSPSPDCVALATACGAVSAQYTALADGTATVTTTRTDCGTGATCSGDSAQWQVTVNVGASSSPSS